MPGSCDDPGFAVETAALLAARLGEAPPLAFAPSDRREHRSLSADPRLAARELGYAPRVTLEEGLAAQVAAANGHRPVAPAIAARAAR